MTGNGYIKQLAEASKDMEGASLTVGARIDDELSDTIRETMRLPQFRDGAFASDVAIAIFGEPGNSQILAVDTRLLLMRDAGMVTWENGLFRLVSDEATIDDHEACLRVLDALKSVLRGCEYDHEVIGGYIMSEEREVGGFSYRIEFYIDDSEDELVAEDLLDWDEHLVRITISPVEA